MLALEQANFASEAGQGAHVTLSSEMQPSWPFQNSQT